MRPIVAQLTPPLEEVRSNARTLCRYAIQAGDAHPDTKIMSDLTDPIRLNGTASTWPLLFHLEPLVASIPWKDEVDVTVVDEAGTHTYPTVAEARAHSRQTIPNRVELYARSRQWGVDRHEGVKAGVWVVGFGDGEQPVATIYHDPGMRSDGERLREAAVEFADESERATPAPAAGGTASASRLKGWAWITNQPMAVAIVGGVIATLVAAGLLALITFLIH